MRKIEYLRFEEVDPKELMAVLNEASLRAHLVEHPDFDDKSLAAWIKDKLELDAMDGCCVRVVAIDETIAGWCGIQPDEQGFELAIVISQRFWGVGMSIFKTLLQWAESLGHNEVCFHLLDSRREYKALAKMAKTVTRTQMLGRDFTTYRILVGQKEISKSGQPSE